MAVKMKSLSVRNYELIRRMVKSTGSYDPDESLYMIEEELYVDEIRDIIAFLTWLHVNDLGMGSGNYKERFKEFLQSQK